MENLSFQKWKEFYLNAEQSSTEQLWPCENLVRMFKGKYISDFDKSFSGKKIIEIGFGSGNNLVFFNTLGLKLFGTEVAQEICDNYLARLKSLNINALLKEGTNINIPFEDNSFDYLVSWNVIHYENSEENIMKAIQEYSRVLKPGGRIFISTTGPENSILRNCITLGNHKYEISRNDTFRKEEVYFYFDNENYINYYFSKYFDSLKIGRTKTDLFSECLDWFLITGIKRGK
jgi:ubiquinone/menaquinone biosynthesis C-methylase UbiE